MRTSEQLIELAKSYAMLFKSYRPDFSKIDQYSQEHSIYTVDMVDDTGRNFIHALCIVAEDQRSDPAVKAIRHYIEESNSIDIDFADKKGITAIMIACEGTNVELIKLLCEAKCDIFRMDINGVNAVMRSFVNNKYAILQAVSEQSEFTDDQVKQISDTDICQAAGVKYEEAFKRRDKEVCRLIRGSVGVEYIRRRYPNNAYDAAKNKQSLSRYTGAAVGGITTAVSSMWNYFF